MLPIACEIDRAYSNSLFVDGNWKRCDGTGVIDIVDPSTGDRFLEMPAASAADIDVAVAAARGALVNPAWADLSPPGRARLLDRLADLIERDAACIAAIEARDVGMPIKFAHMTIQIAIRTLRHCAGLAQTFSSPNVDGLGREFLTYARREPVGVVGLITPWNGPFVLLCSKLGSALAAGCTCVIKPPELAPTSSLALMDFVREADIPAGVVNLVLGTGADAGAALAQHPGVDKISFTGSTRTGQSLIHAAAGNLTRLTLELGGKSPLIVMDDADLDQAVVNAAWGIFGNSGQACYASSRLYVQRGIYADFLSRLRDYSRTFRIGAAGDPDTDLGPLISAAQRERVAAKVDEARDDGASILTGGGELPGPGYFYAPTIITDAEPGSEIMRDEIFGPVLCASPFDDFDAVLGEANDTRYGLAAGIFTRDISNAHRAAQRMRAGTIWVNCYATIDPSQPFGGYGMSGWGREFGPNALDPFLETKSVVVQIDQPSF